MRDLHVSDPKLGKAKLEDPVPFFLVSLLEYHTGRLLVSKIYSPNLLSSRINISVMYALVLLN
jgi:hypothetical protein